MFLAGLSLYRVLEIGELKVSVILYFFLKLLKSISGNIISSTGFDDQFVFRSENMPGSRYFSCTVEIDDRWFLFGGYGYSQGSGSLGDLWEYRPDINQWRYIRGMVGRLGSKSNMSFSNDMEVRSTYGHVCWTQDSKLYVHGGKTIDFTDLFSTFVYGDVQAYDPYFGPIGAWRVVSDSLSYSKGFGRFSTNFSQPSYPYMGLSFHTATKMSEDSVVFFGGEFWNWFQDFNIVYEWNATMNEFRYVKGGPMMENPGEIPNALDWELYSRNDTDGYGNRGIHLTPYRPRPRSMHTAWSYNSYLYIFGGKQGLYQKFKKFRFLSDVWRLDTITWKWAWIGGLDTYDYEGNYVGNFSYSENPPGLALPIQWMGYRNELVVLFGGFSQVEDSKIDSSQFLNLYHNKVWIFSLPRGQFKCLNINENETLSSLSLKNGRAGSSIFNIMNNYTLIFSGVSGEDNKKTMHRDLYEFRSEYAVHCHGHGNVWFNPSNEDSGCVCDGIGIYSGNFCADWNCYNISRHNSSFVCSFGNGECNDHNSCICKSGYCSDDCGDFDCFGISKNNISNVCSGNGICSKPDVCSCYSNYSEKTCDSWKCFGIFKNDTSFVCSNGNGVCVAPNDCDCIYGSYDGNQCEEINMGNVTCNGILHNSSFVCSNGSGECLPSGKCGCKDGYYGSDCEYFNCYEVRMDDVNSVCNGHGICGNPNNCSCEESNHYYGSECQEYLCQAIYYEHYEEIVVTYQIPMELAKKHMEEETFDCSLIFTLQSEQQIFGVSNPTCYWDFSLHQTHVVHVDLEGLGDNFDKSRLYQGLSFKSLSSNRSVEMPVEMVLIPLEEGDDKDEGQSQYIYLSFLSGIVIFPILICIGGQYVIGCCVCYVLCCCVCCVVISARIFTDIRNRDKKLRNVKRKDMYLSEHKIREDSRRKHEKQKKEDSTKRGSRVDNPEISKTLFEVNFEDVNLIRVIGSGGSDSTVYLAEYSKQKVAFKVFKGFNETKEEEILEEFEREVGILSSLSHPYVLAFLGAALRLPRCGILTEYCEHGDMKNYMKSTPHSFSVLKKLQILQQIGSAIEFLHARNVIHRDLKTSNVFLKGTEFTPKVADFGISKALEGSKGAKAGHTKRAGTSQYMAPEVIDGNYGEPCDVFSFSIMMFEIVTENWNPYGEKLDFNVELRVRNDENFRPSLNEIEGLEELCEMIRWCWKGNPKERMDIVNVVEALERIRTKKEQEEQLGKETEEDFVE